MKTFALLAILNGNVYILEDGMSYHVCIMTMETKWYDGYYDEVKDEVISIADATLQCVAD